jgi:competence protein ComEC
VQDIAQTVLGRAGQGRVPFFGALSLRAAAALRAAIEQETALRRPFLWTPVAMGAGTLLYFSADHEPSLAFAATLFFILAGAALATRNHPRLCLPLIVAACIAGGFVSAAWRTARIDAPVLTRIGVGAISGYVEQVDHRRAGARFVLRVASAQGLPGDVTPARVRLSTRGEAPFKAGDFIALKARLLPPAQGSLPGGYDFARDAYFMRLGAVGSALGRIEIKPAPEAAPWTLRFFAAIDRARNALALRVYDELQGDEGAIAAAMVAGKRDFLSESAKELIRRAGIFHVVTISGVQMTLVAGIFFVGLRRLFACSRTLALNHPIKKWAAALAILGAFLYDIGTGSRVGTERALIMTIAMLVAVLLDRPAFSMRNLALAAICVILFEPEAILGASFQLSFAAVAALIAVFEARDESRTLLRARGATARKGGALAKPDGPLLSLWRALLMGPGAALFATICATLATASFMAGNFQELSPYVLIGNPLTLAIIEFFAVPCALLGAVLYPLGLDGLVWRYLGLGIELITYIARLIASAPGAGLPIKSFAPWAMVFLALALLSIVLWRTNFLRATALPFALLGLLGATANEGFDLAVAPGGEAAAVRVAGGALALLGKKTDNFVAEQWLRADADPRAPSDARSAAACDDYGCVARAYDGRLVALVLKKEALLEDCAKAAIIVTPLAAPQGCGAPVVVDRRRLEETGAVTLRLKAGQVEWTSARRRGEDRPWSRPPAPRPRAAAEATDHEADEALPDLEP